MSGDITADIIKLFDEFDGEKEALEDFLEGFNRILSAFSLNKAKGFKILPLKLRGKAERAYRTAKRTGRIHDYQSLVTELGRALATEGSRIQAKYGLALEMREGDSVSEFADRIRRNTIKAYPNFIESHLESLMADAFTRGCTPHLKAKMMNKVYTNLADAQDKAELIMTQLAMRSRDTKEIGDISRKLDKLTEAMLNAKLKEDSVNFTSNEDGRRSNSCGGTRRDSGTFERYGRSQGGQNGENFERDRTYSRERTPTPERPQRDNMSSFQSGGQRNQNSWTPRTYENSRGNFGGRGPYQQTWNRDGNQNNGFQHSGGNEVPEGRNSYTGSFNNLSAGNQYDQNTGRYNGHNNRGDYHNNRGNYRGGDGGYSAGFSGGQRRGYSGGAGFNGRFTTMMIVAMACLSILPMAEASTYYRCGRSENSALMFIPDDSNTQCTAAWDNRMTISTVGLLYRPPGKEQSIDAIACSEVITHTCIQAIGKIFFTEVTVSTEEKPVSREECLVMDRTKMFRGTRLETVDTRVWKTAINGNSTPDIPFTAFTGPTCSDQSHGLLQRGHLFDIGQNNLVSNLGNLQGCGIEDKGCTNANRTILWNERWEMECHHLIGQFKVLVNNGTMVIADLNRILHQRDAPQVYNDCLRQRLTPLTGDLYVFLPEYSSIRNLYDLGLAHRGRRETQEEYEALFVAGDMKEYVQTLFDGRRSFAADPLQDYALRKAIQENDVQWSDVFYQMVSYQTLHPSEYVLRAVVFRRFKNNLIARTMPWSASKLRNVLRKDVNITEEQARNRARFEGAHGDEDFMTRMGDRLYVIDLSDMDYGYMDLHLSQNAIIAYSVDMATRNQRMTMYIRSELLKGIADLRKDPSEQETKIRIPYNFLFMEQPPRIRIPRETFRKNGMAVSSDRGGMLNWLTWQMENEGRVPREVTSTEVPETTTQDLASFENVFPVAGTLVNLFKGTEQPKQEVRVEFVNVTTTRAPETSTTTTSRPTTRQPEPREDHDINRMALHICEREINHKAELIRRFNEHPTREIQRLTFRHDIRAVREAENVWGIQVCDKLVPDEVLYKNRMVEGMSINCYKFLPIRVNGEQLFVDELTSHVEESSPIVECKYLQQYTQNKRSENTHVRTMKQARSATITPAEVASKDASVPVLTVLREGVVSTEQYKEDKTLWGKVKSKFDEITLIGVNAAKAGSAKVTNFAVDVKEKVIEYTTRWAKILLKWLIIALCVGVVGVIMYFTFKYWLWLKLLSCCCPSPRVVISEVSDALKPSPKVNRVNFVSRRRTPEERYISEQERIREEEALELIEFHAREVRTKPRLQTLSMAVAIVAALACLPGAEATDGIVNGVPMGLLLTVATVLTTLAGITWTRRKSRYEENKLKIVIHGEDGRFSCSDYNGFITSERLFMRRIITKDLPNAIMEHGCTRTFVPKVIAFTGTPEEMAEIVRRVNERFPQVGVKADEQFCQRKAPLTPREYRELFPGSSLGHGSSNPNGRRRMETQEDFENRVGRRGQRTNWYGQYRDDRRRYTPVGYTPGEYIQDHRTNRTEYRPAPVIRTTDEPQEEEGSKVHETTKTHGRDASQSRIGPNHLAEYLEYRKRKEEEGRAKDEVTSEEDEDIPREEDDGEQQQEGTVPSDEESEPEGLNERGANTKWEEFLKESRKKREEWLAKVEELKKKVEEIKESRATEENEDSDRGQSNRRPLLRSTLTIACIMSWLPEAESAGLSKGSEEGMIQYSTKNVVIAIGLFTALILMGIAYLATCCWNRRQRERRGLKAWKKEIQLVKRQTEEDGYSEISQQESTGSHIRYALAVACIMKNTLKVGDKTLLHQLSGQWEGPYILTDISHPNATILKKGKQEKITEDDKGAKTTSPSAINPTSSSTATSLSLSPSPTSPTPTTPPSEDEQDSSDVSEEM